MGDPQTLGLQPLSEALWAERHELESLLARVVALRLVLQAGEHRFVSACLGEVEGSLHALAARTLAREAAAADAPGGPMSLGELAVRAPTPFAWAFGEHEASLRGLVEDLDREVRATRRLARSAREQTLDSLSILRSASREHMSSAPAALADLGSAMELELRAQACRGVLVALQDLLPGSLRALLGRTD